MTSDSVTGCKPDLELSSRRYCILSRCDKFKTLPLHGPGARPPWMRLQCQSYDLGLAVTGCKPDLELSSRRYCILSRCDKFKTLPLHGPGARPPWTRLQCQSYDLGLAVTGCKPDLELSSMRYCFGAAAVRRCPLLVTDCRRLGPAASRRSRARQLTQQLFEMLDVRIEGLFLLCDAMMFAMK